MWWNLGFETTADIHAVPAHAARHSYGAVGLSTTPPPTVVNEFVVHDSDLEQDEIECNEVPAVDRPQVGDASIQHSNNVVLVAVDLPAPDQSTI